MCGSIGRDLRTISERRNPQNIAYENASPFHIRQIQKKNYVVKDLICKIPFHGKVNHHQR